MTEDGAEGSSVVVFQGPIEQSIDLTEPCLSVTERYYTPYYKVDEDRSRRNDLCLLLHSNRISLVCLAPSHPIVVNGLNVSAVDCEISKKVDRKNNRAVGKSKKGGQNLDPTSVLCYLETEDTKYPILALAPGKLICMNNSVLKDPNLVRLKPDSEGHIAILLPYLGQIQECKEGLLTKEDFEDFLRKEG